MVVVTILLQQTQAHYYDKGFINKLLTSGENTLYTKEWSFENSFSSRRRGRIEVILIIDEVKGLRSRLAAKLAEKIPSLEESDFLFADNAEEGFAVLCQDPKRIDLVITNFSTGTGPNAIEFGERVKKEIPRDEQPLISLYTKKITVEVVDPCFNGGMLQKDPENMSHVVNAVIVALKKRARTSSILEYQS
jgi:hypothetical protein